MKQLKAIRIFIRFFPLWLNVSIYKFPGESSLSRIGGLFVGITIVTTSTTWQWVRPLLTYAALITMPTAMLSNVSRGRHATYLPRNFPIQLQLPVCRHRSNAVGASLHVSSLRAGQCEMQHGKMFPLCHGCECKKITTNSNMDSLVIAIFNWGNFRCRICSMQIAEKLLQKVIWLGIATNVI